MIIPFVSSIRQQPCRDHLLIACMPKSGSTYLHTVLREITGLGDATLCELGDQNEGDIYEKRLRRLRRRSVIQQHVKATQTNLKWLMQHGVRPIVQTRSLFDVVPSLHDHFDSARETGGLPCGYVGRDFWDLSWNGRMEYLIRIHLPWYLNFLLSWSEAAERIETCPVSYEELFADPFATLSRILDFYRVTASRQQIAAAMARTRQRNTRFNVGISGRGVQLLTSGHKRMIRDLAATCGFEVSDTGSVATATRAAMRTPAARSPEMIRPSLRRAA
jgi:hypothetical protein